MQGGKGVVSPEKGRVKGSQGGGRGGGRKEGGPAGRDGGLRDVVYKR